MSYTSSDRVDSLPELGDLLRELFDLLDVDQHPEDAVIVEDEEYGEDIEYDEELLPAQVAGDPCRRCRSWICEDPDVRPVHQYMLESMLLEPEYYELSSEDQDHIRLCQLGYYEFVLLAGRDA